MKHLIFFFIILSGLFFACNDLALEDIEYSITGTGIVDVAYTGSSGERELLYGVVLPYSFFIKDNTHVVEFSISTKNTISGNTVCVSVSHLFESDTQCTDIIEVISASIYHPERDPFE